MALVVNKAKKAPATIKSVIPAHIDSSEVLDLGSGLCRGPKWQLNNWPKDEGKYLINLVHLKLHFRLGIQSPKINHIRALFLKIHPFVVQ